MTTTLSNLAAFAQYRRAYSAVTATANTTYTDVPTNTALLYCAGPDGSLVTKVNSMPRATAVSNQMQFFLSKDGGTTNRLFASSLIAAYTSTTSSQVTGTAMAQVDGTLISETNPIPLTGQSGFVTTISSSPTFGGTSQGSVNAQTLPLAASIIDITAGTIVDFEAGLTNTAALTLKIGTGAVTAVVRDYNGAALSAGDVTAGFRYRVWSDGSNWRLVITDRLYVAQGITLASGITTTAQGCDF